MPRKNSTIQSVPEPETSTPIQMMTGHQSSEDMANDLPSSTTATQGDGKQRGPNGRLLKKDGTERAPKGQRTRTTQQPMGNPLMDDPIYRKHISNLNFFNAPRIISAGAEGLAAITKDADMALNTSEKDEVEGYFYCLSKHLQYDPMGSAFGRIIVFIGLLCGLAVRRILKHTDVAKLLVDLINNNAVPKAEKLAQ